MLFYVFQHAWWKGFLQKPVIFAGAYQGRRDICQCVNLKKTCLQPFFLTCKFETLFEINICPLSRENNQPSLKESQHVSRSFPFQGRQVHKGIGSKAKWKFWIWFFLMEHFQQIGRPNAHIFFLFTWPALDVELWKCCNTRRNSDDVHWLLGLPFKQRSFYVGN